MKRRNFLSLSAYGYAGFYSSFGLAGDSKENQRGTAQKNGEDAEYRTLITDLIQDWCAGMLHHQINKPEDKTLHGALWCEACQKIHGRCMDAVYPFMYSAHHAKNEEEKDRYLTAAIDVMEWSNNVSKPDGSWTVIPDPTSWAGITVFGMIALAESLHHHSEVLPDTIRKAWTERLALAADYVYKNFNHTFTNINYGFTAVYGLNLVGRMFDNKHYLARSRELAKDVKLYFTEPNKLVFGENKPVDARSAKGLLSVDLGYNVEETLNGLVLYALYEKDKELLSLLEKSLNAHLEFMLPDGGWDNSWGTRQAKWTYWGSRTTHGCQVAYAFMAPRNPQFATAVYANTLLLKCASVNNLLAGGLHFKEHNVKPCIHHTFSHLQPLVALLDSQIDLSKINVKSALPRAIANGVKNFSEVDVSLFARGPWRGTVSCYDALYGKNVQQATGGAIAILWHEQLGPVMTASMAKYVLAEVNNQQANVDDEDIALTPRVEGYYDDRCYTHLYDLKATATFTDKVTSRDKAGVIEYQINAELLNEDRKQPNEQKIPVSLQYKIAKEQFTFIAPVMATYSLLKDARLTLPLISVNTDTVKQLSANKIEIIKPKGTLVLEANVPLMIRKTKRARTFNLVPGVEALVVDAYFAEAAKLPEGEVKEIRCSLQVI